MSESVPEMTSPPTKSTHRPRWPLLLAFAVVIGMWPLSASGAAEPTSDPAAGLTEPPSDAVSGGVEIVRYAAADGYGLSIELASALVASAGGTSEWVVLASGESWADAVVAGPLAASLDAPVLLVPPGGLQSPTARPELVAFLRSAGVRRVVIVGSPEVLPNHEPSVLFGLGMLPRNIERVHGADPIGTAIAVAERLGTPPELGELGRTAIIASGQSVADAVALGPLAAAGPFPLLLTAPDALDPRIVEYLSEHEVGHVVLVGGEAAMAPAVEDAIGAAGVQVTRLAGVDRYHTAALAMDLLAQSPRCADEAIDNIGLVLAEEPRLALTTGRLLGPQCIPLLFTDADRLAPVTQNHLYLYQHRTGVEPNWHLIGDTSIDLTAIERPPVRMATVADNPDGDGQHIVVLDEHHQPTRYLLDAGFDGITHVRWTADGSVISFTGIRDGMPYVDEEFRDGAWASRETVQGGTRRTYELKLRSGTARPHSPFPSWYAHLAQDSWIDPKPSPDRKVVVFRKPADGYAGHSLFALDVDSGEVQRLTHNATNDTHHVVSSDWLADGRRLVYTHVKIAQLEGPAPETDTPGIFRAYLYPDSGPLGGACRNVPQQQAHVVDVATGQVHSLPHGGYLIDEPIALSPDDRYVAIKSYEDYEFAPERDFLQFFYYRCTHDGIGPPTISVYDLSGPEPRAVTDAGLMGFDPTWSPDSSYMAFRAPTEESKGHSLFAVGVAVGDVSRLTHNRSDEHHHVAQHWLSDGSQLLYTVQSIELRDAQCYEVSPAQQRPQGVPHIEARIISIPELASSQLEFPGIVTDYYDSGFDLSPDGRHISFTSHSGYEVAVSQGGCGYWGQGDAQLHVYDIGGESLRRVTFDRDAVSGTSWSPDGRYLAYRGSETSNTGPPDTTFSILDTDDGSVWRIPLSEIFEADAWLSDVAWTPDGSRLLYNVRVGDYRNRTYATVIADVEAEQVVRLAIPEGFRGDLRFFDFSTDGGAVMHRSGSGFDFETGKVMVHDIEDGSLLGLYDSYAATEPGASVFHDPEDIAGDNIVEGFRFSAVWSPAGIFVSGEYYLWWHHDI